MGTIVPDPVEAYLAGLNQASDPLLDEIAREGARLGLPLIDASVGRLLSVVATAIGARRALEIGTAIGYSGLWIAKALASDGRLLTIEMDPDRARTARDHFARAGLGDRVSVMIGDAKGLLAKVAGPLDLIFQDGDKLLYGPLLDRLAALLRPGGVLVTDNVLWSGRVVPGFVTSGAEHAEETRAIAEYNERLTAHPALMTVIVPLRDGVALSVKKSHDG